MLLALNFERILQTGHNYMCGDMKGETHYPVYVNECKA